MEKLSKRHIVARLRGRLKETDKSMREVSLAAGLEEAYLSQLFRITNRWPTLDNLQAICDAIGLRLSWVATGSGSRLVSDPDFSADITLVPVVSWVAASPFSDSPTIEREAELPHILVPNLGRGDFIALTVHGDSMNRVAPDGATIVVDRADTTLVSRAFYVFSRDGGAEATFKRWMADPDRLMPFSTNQDHEPIYPTLRPNVIGRVRKVLIDL